MSDKSLPLSPATNYPAAVNLFSIVDVVSLFVLFLLWRIGGEAGYPPDGLSHQPLG